MVRKHYICITQGNNSNSYRGHSGESYTSMRGRPFPVDNPIDQEYFSAKKQFEEVGHKTVKKLEKKPLGRDDGKAMEKALRRIKGLRVKSIKRLVNDFNSLDLLKSHYRENTGTVPEYLTKKESKALIEFLHEILAE